MATKPAYCPNCGEPLTMREQNLAGEVIYFPCKTQNARCSKLSIITDMKGYIINPSAIKGWYIHSRVYSEKNRR